MSSSKDGLEITQDLSLQRREWRVQKVLWVLIAAVLIAALAGLIGPGPLSYSSVGGSGFRVTYLRFARWQAPNSLVITASGPQGGPLRIEINRSYLASTAVQQITPEPSSVSSTGGAYLYTFQSTGVTTSTTVTFDLQPTSMGRLHAKVAPGPGAGGSPVEFSQFVYP
jgi:hypothetical protein